MVEEKVYLTQITQNSHLGVRMVLQKGASGHSVVLGVLSGEDVLTTFLENVLANEQKSSINVN
jgi:hypothetical protein